VERKLRATSEGPFNFDHRLACVSARSASSFTLDALVCSWHHSQHSLIPSPILFHFHPRRDDSNRLRSTDELPFPSAG
jgi:hypothetical protein